MKLNRLTIAVAGCLLLLICCASAMAAQPGFDLEIILDGSGSMMSRIGEQTKMDIAKKALLDLVGELADRPDLALGVRVYGHQSDKSKKDCTDSRLEIPFGWPDPAAAGKLMKKIRPRGYTPIAFSLLEAAGDFDVSAPRKRSIVLITDGLETCDGDPCAAAEKLAAAGMEVTLHVVGFDLSTEDMNALKCLTAPSGGLLLEARDAAQLSQALETAVRKSVAVNLIVSAKTSAGKPREVFVEIFKSGGGEKIDIRQAPVTKYQLAPGLYDIQARDYQTRQTAMLKNVEVFEDRVTEQDIVFDSGDLSTTLKSAEGKPLKGWAEVWRMENGEEKDHLGDYVLEKGRIFHLPAGNYKMLAQVDSMGHKQVVDNLVIEPDQTLVREFVFDMARLGLMVRDGGGQPVSTYLEVWRMEDGSPASYKSGKTGSEPLFFDLVAGDYLVQVSRPGGGEKIKTSLSLTGGQNLVQDIVIQ